MEPLIEKTALERLHRQSPVRSVLAIGGDWAGIVTLLGLAVAFPSPVVLTIVFVAMARQQHALLVLMHDAAHRRLTRGAWWNDVLGQVFTASPLFFSLDGYRFLHLRHHAKPLSPEDPDLPLNGGYPVSEASFRRKLARDLTGRTYVKAAQYFLFVPPAERRSPLLVARHPWLVGILVNALLFAALILAGHPLYYFGLWLLPLMTLLQAILRLRGVAEHSGYRPDPDQRLCTRTVGRGWQSWLLAPHAVNFHVEHHAYPGVPFYHLPELHRRFREAGAIPEASYACDYREVVRRIVVREPAE